MWEVRWEESVDRYRALSLCLPSTNTANSTGRNTSLTRRAQIEARLTEIVLPYTSIEWTQPDADLYIDHNVVDSLQGDLSSQVGFYPGTEAKVKWTEYQSACQKVDSQCPLTTSRLQTRGEVMYIAGLLAGAIVVTVAGRLFSNTT